MDDNFQIDSNRPGLTTEEYKMSLDAETQQKKNRNGMVAFLGLLTSATIITLAIIASVAGWFG